MGKYIVIICMIVLLSFAAYAADTPKDGITTQVGESGKVTETGAQTAVAVEGGNITTLNISTAASTGRWQGFVGNTSGSLALGRGADILFSFGNAEFDSVFATTTNALDWGNLQASTANAVDTQWGFSVGADQAADAFTGSNSIEGITVPTVSLTGAFLCGLFQDRVTASSKDHFAFGGEVYTPAKAGFDNGEYNYEIIVPTEDNTETYYLYLSLAE
jgi:hypothetical protein